MQIKLNTLLVSLINNKKFSTKKGFISVADPDPAPLVRLGTDPEHEAKKIDSYCFATSL
jgi:hypothetical protein